MDFYRLPMILQQAHADCGHACIAMVAAFFGHDMDLHALQRRFPASAKGITLPEMRHICWQLQLETIALKADLSDLPHIPLPAIVHWELNHFVVLKKVKKKQVWIHDPAVGVRKCTMEVFSRAFTGIILTVKPAQTFQSVHWREKLTLWHFIRQIKGLSRVVFFMLLLSLGIECAALVPGFITQIVTDHFVDTVMGKNTLTFLSAAFILMLMGGVMGYLRGHYLLSFSTQIKSQLHVNVMRHVLKLPFTYFQQRHAAHIQFIFQMIEEVQKKVSTEWLEGLIEVFFLVLVGGVMFFYSVTLSLVACAWLVAGMLSRFLTFEYVKMCKQNAVHQRGRCQAFFMETLQFILPLKAASKEMERFFQWRDVYTRALNEEVQVLRCHLMQQSLNQWVQQTEYLCVIAVGLYLIQRDKLSIGMLLAFVSYRGLWVEKAYRLMQRVMEYSLMQVELEKLADIFKHTAEETQACLQQPRTIQQGIRLRGISFRYSEQEPFLFKNLDLDISLGEKIAIIGPSGAGKSTLLKLMLGLLLPTEGDIYIDKLKLGDFGMPAYRRLIASVMQADRLLQGSILENILFFDEKKDNAWFKEVLAYTALDDWVDTLPMGVETRIGEQGCLVSGGQRQRILLARALYQRPKIVFLDEASSQWDIALERHIHQAISHLPMAQIIVAHRPETIAMADKTFRLCEP